MFGISSVKKYAKIQFQVFVFSPNSYLPHFHYPYLKTIPRLHQPVSSLCLLSSTSTRSLSKTDVISDSITSVSCYVLQVYNMSRRLHHQYRMNDWLASGKNVLSLFPPTFHYKRNLYIINKIELHTQHLVSLFTPHKIAYRKGLPSNYHRCSPNTVLFNILDSITHVEYSHMNTRNFRINLRIV